VLRAAKSEPTTDRLGGTREFFVFRMQAPGSYTTVEGDRLARNANLRRCYQTRPASSFSITARSEGKSSCKVFQTRRGVTSSWLWR
jgi:hypothetical protein